MNISSKLYQWRWGNQSEIFSIHSFKSFYWRCEEKNNKKREIWIFFAKICVITVKFRLVWNFIWEVERRSWWCVPIRRSRRHLYDVFKYVSKTNENLSYSCWDSYQNVKPICFQSYRVSKSENKTIFNSSWFFMSHSFFIWNRNHFSKIDYEKLSI